MRVLVAVNVRQRNPVRLYFANLRFYFPLDFLRDNLLANCGHSKLL